MPTAEDSTNEIWKPILNFVGYEASDFGRIKSLDAMIGAKGNSKRFLAGRILSPARLPKGYLTVQLSRDGKKFRRTIHQLVLESFVGPRPPNHCCCHKNGKPSDNRLCNLRWDTYKANEQEKRAHGTYFTRTGTPGNTNNAKLTAKRVKQIKLLLAAGVSQKDVAVCFHVSKSTVNLIALGTTWKNT